MQFGRVEDMVEAQVYLRDRQIPGLTVRSLRCQPAPRKPKSAAPSKAAAEAAPPKAAAEAAPSQAASEATAVPATAPAHDTADLGTSQKAAPPLVPNPPSASGPADHSVPGPAMDAIPVQDFTIRPRGTVAATMSRDAQPFPPVPPKQFLPPQPVGGPVPPPPPYQPGPPVVKVPGGWEVRFAYSAPMFVQDLPFGPGLHPVPPPPPMGSSPPVGSCPQGSAPPPPPTVIPRPSMSARLQPAVPVTTRGKSGAKAGPMPSRAHWIQYPKPVPSSAGRAVP